METLFTEPGVAGNVVSVRTIQGTVAMWLALSVLMPIGGARGLAAAQSAGERMPPAPFGVHVFGAFQFSGPAAIASASGDVWVANYAGDSVTEVDAKSGTLLRLISSAKYRLVGPVAVAVAGADVWVANAGGSVTEVNAKTGSLVRVISASRYRF